MPHPDSHSGSPLSSKNAAKGALNVRGEAIAFFHLPSESLSSQEAEFLDTSNLRRNYPPLTWFVNLNISINTGRLVNTLATLFTNNSKPTNDPAHSEPLQQLFPPPSEEYDCPRQMGVDSTQHWTSEIEINESWDTQQVLERIIKYHSIPTLTKYIRSHSLLSAPDIDE